jgi:hypothetical protein
MTELKRCKSLLKFASSQEQTQGAIWLVNDSLWSNSRVALAGQESAVQSQVDLQIALPVSLQR